MATTKRRLQDAATATGVGNTLAVSRYSHIVFQVSGTFVGTITFQATVDGSNWHNILPNDITTGVSSATTTTTGLYRVDVTGLSIVRANITVYTSGSITVIGRARDEE